MNDMYIPMHEVVGGVSWWYDGYWMYWYARENQNEYRVFKRGVWYFRAISSTSAVALDVSGGTLKEETIAALSAATEMMMHGRR